MKISAISNSKNLRKEDVPQPFIAIISEVRVQTFEKTARSPREDKDMLHFADPNVKPLGLNVTNKRILIATYGDETDHWRGQPVEIYVDPNVTNSRGEIVGGIRLRIPTRPTIPMNGTAGPPKPLNGHANGRAKPMTLEEKHRYVLKALREAKDEAKLKLIADWTRTQDFLQHQWDEQSDEHHRALERIALANAPTTRQRDSSDDNPPF